MTVEKKARGPGRRFVKGQSGNPSGRPSTVEIRKALLPMQADALQALHNAIRGGESWAVTLWCHYTYGKPIEAVELTGAGGEGLTISINGIRK